MEQRVVLGLLLIGVVWANACDVARECPNDEEVTWATDGTACHVFHNRCFLENVNCHHKSNQVHELQVISKEQCQALCVTDCPVDDNPVCGFYKDQQHTFANQCEMDAHICQTGEPMFVYEVGQCDK